MDETIEKRLNAFIKSKGLRKTPQRDAIVKAIFDNGEHFTAEELWERISHSDHLLSRATMYRTISLLVEAKLLHQVDLGKEHKTYDPNFLNRPDHNHLICVDCGKILEFEDANVETLTDCLTRRLGFLPAKQSLRIEASCDHSECSKSK